MKLFVKRYSLDNVVQTSQARYIYLDEPAGENDTRTYDFSHFFANRDRPAWRQALR